MRYLFGPTNPAFADEFLAEPRRDGTCLCLGADVPLQSDDTWADVAERFPGRWRPDRLLLWLPNPDTPDWVWTAPVPLLGLAPDWDLLPHYYRHTLPLCDLVLADPPTVLALAAAGSGRTRVADLSGLGRSAFDRSLGDDERDIDILVIDDLHPAVRRDRLPWVGRIAQLSDSARVVIRRPAGPTKDREWLARAKVFIQLPSASGDDRLAYEAIAGGAALLRVTAPWDGPDWLRPGVDYAPYDGRTLEDNAIRLVSDEAARASIAGAARARAPEFAFAARLDRVLAAVAAQQGELEAHAAQRAKAGAPPGLGASVWAAVATGKPGELPLPGGPDDRPELAVVRGVFATDPETAVGHFQQALRLDPTHPVAAANLAEALVRAGRTEEAVAAAQSALAQLDVASGRPFIAWDVPLYPPEDGLARTEWERAVWMTGGDLAAESEAKRAVLRWRLHALCARLADDLSHYHEAAFARPDVPSARAALGCALARRERPAEGLWHLKAAVVSDPFDRAAARALFAAMEDAGDRLGRRLFARQQRRLATAAPEACPAEPWFTEAGPVGDELASIIVVVHDLPEITRVCLESVLRHTRRPFELILVDNGCNPETAALLEEFAGRPGPARAAVLQTGANLGYPAAANHGLAAARGEFLVLLNNDAVVSLGWLEGLTEPLCAGWPHVGLVGPVTNFAPDPQRVPAGYTDLEDLDAFAAARRRARSGAMLHVPRLSGFCLLTHRRAFEAIGPLDERFGVGFFDDDDWGVRARRAGYALIVAEDTYVHHFGSATFHALGKNTDELLQASFKVFREKWGDDEVSPYRRPDGTPLRRPTVSLCMIVRNEEKYLPDCLASVRDLVDEVVIIDTGSTDRTKEVAAGFGAKVFDFPWVDSFAAARNESLRHATGDWVFWMDADDRLDEANRGRLRELLGSLTFEPAAFVMKCRCLPDTPGASATVVDHVRLFRNDPRLRWRYRVHEQILPAIRAAGFPVRWSDVVVTHVGYADRNARGGKLERDLRLLRLEEGEQPDDPFTLFNLGQVMAELGRQEEALPYLRRSLDRSHPRDSIVRKLYAQIAQCHRSSGRSAEALTVVAEGREHYPDDAELLFIEGVLRQEREDWAGAAECWRRLVEGREGEHFASVDAGLRGAKARHNLAVSYSRLGRPDDALAEWRAAVAADPAFVPGWVALGAFGLTSGDRALIEEAADRLEALGAEGQREAAALRVRMAADGYDFAPVSVEKAGPPDSSR